MKLLHILTVFASAAAVFAAPTPEDVVQDRFIVKFKRDAGNAGKGSVEDHYAWLESQLTMLNGRLPYNPEIMHKYDIGSLSGFMGYAVKAPGHIIESIKDSPIVEYVHEDGVVTTFGEQKNPPSWGLTRTSQKKLDLSKSYTWESDGTGVTVYVIDTGIVADHPEFEGRATLGASFVENFEEIEELTDGNGHGTHCSGTVGSKSYGVAKNAKLVGVKVLSASGSGTYAGVIAGIEWVAKNAVPGKSVASMSLGGPKSQPVNDAVNAAVAKNIPFAVAAGNSYGQNACNVSPAGASEVFTVAASDKTDTLASFSNAGPCVKIIAPGVDITSTWMNNGVNTISGTSMATPHVAGVFALLLSNKSYASAKDVYADMISMSTPNAIKRVPANTVNKLLYNGAGVLSEDEVDVE